MTRQDLRGGSEIEACVHVPWQKKEKKFYPAQAEAYVIPVNEPLLDGCEKEFLTKCIDTGWISSEGPFVNEFEDKFAKLIGRKYGVAVSNGSAAMDVAISAIGIEKDDEVILPTFTIISPAASIVRAGAIPVLIDSDPFTWNMDVSQIEAKITKKTKALLVVHIYGLPVNMKPVLDIARVYGLKIIEDAAEMHGQTCNDKPCGSFGDISIFSFYSNKIITTGEGGMVATDDSGLAEKCRSLRNLCFQTTKRFVHESLGWNYRMTNMQAAIGLAQLERLREFVERKRHMGKYYSTLLSGVPGIQLPLPKTDYAENIYWTYGIVLNKEVSCDAEEAMRRLKEYNVGTRPFFWPMHEQPVFKKMGLFSNEQYPVAEYLSRKGFYIPGGLALTDTQMDSVANAVRKAIPAMIAPGVSDEGI
ncbi:MAG: DegT/DnrJ/EryC1/StrS family aminotransferase [Candidatus Brocadiaceae bacterium]|nr:DegT/DnrJ/EryC1/StrS family aminotransferase [Candidatus Brocadiaceae bacterium]